MAKPPKDRTIYLSPFGWVQRIASVAGMVAGGMFVWAIDHHAHGWVMVVAIALALVSFLFAAT